jgi:hypothetical protein
MCFLTPYAYTAKEIFIYCMYCGIHILANMLYEFLTEFCNAAAFFFKPVFCFSLPQGRRSLTGIVPFFRLGGQTGQTRGKHCKTSQ